MPTTRIIEGFDAVKEHRAGLSAGGGDLVVKAFGLEFCPEGFHRGVVARVAAPNCARLDADGCEERTKVVARTLAALVVVGK